MQLHVGCPLSPCPTIQKQTTHLNKSLVACPHRAVAWPHPAAEGLVRLTGARSSAVSAFSRSNTTAISSSNSGALALGMQSSGALVPQRRPSLPPTASSSASNAQLVYIDMSQVVGKQVITTSTGRDLGVVACLWIDPRSGEVVSLDLDDKKGVGGTRIANIYLSRLTQIGDVVLVQDEGVLYETPLDGRYGFCVLAGMEVRTRNGDFLGKVRDFAFSPDSGALSKITYDDFGLSFLPVTFFDTFSLPMSDVLSLGPAGVTVADEARYRERKETSGLFAAIPSLLRSLNSGSRAAPAGLLTAGTSESYRQDGSYYLPQGYSYEQWENDVRRWEQETGLSYDQYVRSQAGGGSRSRQLPGAGPSSLQRPALPSRVAADAAAGGYGGGAPMQQQQQGAGSGWPSMQPQQRPQQRPVPQQQQPGYQGQVQRPMPPQRQAAADPRFRGAGGPAGPSVSPYGAPPATGVAPAQRLPAQQQQQPLQQQAQTQQQRPQQPSPAGLQQQRPEQQQQARPGMSPVQSPSSAPFGVAGSAPASPSVGPSAPEGSSRRRMDEYLVPEDRVRLREQEPVAEPAGWGPADGVPARAARGGYYGGSEQ